MEIKTANIFSALQTTSKTQPKTAALLRPQEQKLVTWMLKPVGSWADCEDQDDDEFFSLVAPLPSVLPPLKEELQPSEAEENEEAKDDEQEEEVTNSEEEELQRSTNLQVQKPKAPAPPSKPVLTKKEQRRRELAEIDSVLAELGLLQEVVPKQLDRKKVEEQQCTEAGTSQVSSARTKASTPTEKRCKAKKEKSAPLAQEMEAGEARGAIDHVALRKMAASATSQRGSKRSSGCAAASSSLPCKAAAAEASARAAKVAAAKKKERSKQQNHHHIPR